MSRTVSRAELLQHSKYDDAWVQIGESVYNVTTFAKLHPGGKNVLLDYAGKDATDAFYGCDSLGFSLCVESDSSGSIVTKCLKSMDRSSLLGA